MEPEDVQEDVEPGEGAERAPRIRPPTRLPMMAMRRPLSVADEVDAVDAAPPPRMLRPPRRKGHWKQR